MSKEIITVTIEGSGTKEEIKHSLWIMLDALDEFDTSKDDTYDYEDGILEATFYDEEVNGCDWSDYMH